MFYESVKWYSKFLALHNNERLSCYQIDMKFVCHIIWQLVDAVNYFNSTRTMENQFKMKKKKEEYVVKWQVLFIFLKNWGTNGKKAIRVPFPGGLQISKWMKIVLFNFFKFVEKYLSLTYINYYYGHLIM